jgi:hypothetical protein
VNFRKIVNASRGPIKAITISWVFLILIISFIYLLFFDPIGIFYNLQELPILFGILTIIVSLALFLFWLIVWNTLIHAIFKEDLHYCERNNIDLANET